MRKGKGNIKFRTLDAAKEAERRRRGEEAFSEAGQWVRYHTLCLSFGHIDRKSENFKSLGISCILGFALLGMVGGLCAFVTLQRY